MANAAGQIYLGVSGDKGLTMYLYSKSLSRYLCIALAIAGIGACAGCRAEFIDNDENDINRLLPPGVVVSREYGPVVTKGKFDDAVKIRTEVPRSVPHTNDDPDLWNFVDWIIPRRADDHIHDDNYLFIPKLFFPKSNGPTHNDRLRMSKAFHYETATIAYWDWYKLLEGCPVESRDKFRIEGIPCYVLAKKYSWITKIQVIGADLDGQLEAQDTAEYAANLAHLMHELPGLNTALTVADHGLLSLETGKAVTQDALFFIPPGRAFSVGRRLLVTGALAFSINDFLVAAQNKDPRKMTVAFIQIAIGVLHIHLEARAARPESGWGMPARAKDRPDYIWLTPDRKGVYRPVVSGKYPPQTLPEYEHTMMMPSGSTEIATIPPPPVPPRLQLYKFVEETIDPKLSRVVQGWDEYMLIKNSIIPATWDPQMTTLGGLFKGIIKLRPIESFTEWDYLLTLHHEYYHAFLETSELYSQMTTYYATPGMLRATFIRKNKIRKALNELEVSKQSAKLIFERYLLAGITGDIDPGFISHFMKIYSIAYKSNLSESDKQEELLKIILKEWKYEEQYERELKSAYNWCMSNGVPIESLNGVSFFVRLPQLSNVPQD